MCVAGGETEEERVQADILENQAMHSCTQMGTLCYSPDFVSPHWGRQEFAGGVKGLCSHPYLSYLVFELTHSNPPRFPIQPTHSLLNPQIL